MDREDNKERHSRKVEMLPQSFGNSLFAISGLARIQQTRNERGPFNRIEITRRDILLVVVGLLVGITIGIVFTILGIGAGIMPTNTI